MHMHMPFHLIQYLNPKKKKKKPFYKHGNTKMYIDIPTGIFILI